MTASLFEIGQNFEALEDLLIESGGEVTPEVEAWLAEYGELEAEKMDRYALFIRSQEIAAAALREEETRLADKRRARENAVKRLKVRLLEYMEAREINQIAGKLYKASITKNGGKAPMEMLCAPSYLPKRFQSVSVSADTDAIRAALEAGEVEALEVAKLGEVGRHVRIK